MLQDLLKQNRSYRRFDESVKIPGDKLEDLVALTRWCASGRNAQPLKYRIVCDGDLCEKVFPHLSWAGYLTDWEGPAAGERPVAYLIQLLDTRITENCLCDDGIQAQTILLGATEQGWGGCLIKAFKAQPLSEVLEIPGYMKILYVLALGKPAEEVVLEEMQENDYKYWRDARGIHHVPKRPLSELIF